MMFTVLPLQYCHLAAALLHFFANDDLALLFRQFSEGTISVETLVSEMKFKKLTDQYSFHSEKAIALLKKKESAHV